MERLMQLIINLSDAQMSALLVASYPLPAAVA
jgi:hypothetical protein